MLMRGSRGLAESYSQGMWDSPDLVAVIRLAARNAVLIDRVRALTAPSGPRASACARGEPQHAPAQPARHRRPLRPRQRALLADARSDDDVLVRPIRARGDDARGGVGGQARAGLRAARDRARATTCWRSGPAGVASPSTPPRTRGCRVTTTTISREQHDYAVERIRHAGLSDRITVLMRDYRDLRGSYDKLVSIEMIEAVGWQHIGTFFAKCSELLTSHGAMLLQAITIDDRAYEVEKASKSFIKDYIFPGGCLPSMEVITRNVGAAHRPADRGPAGHHRRATSRPCGAGGRTSPPTPRSSPSSATTRASSGCGRCTWPTARAASPSGGSATFSCCWPSPGGRSRRAPAAHSAAVPPPAEPVSILTVRLTHSATCCRRNARAPHVRGRIPVQGTERSSPT